MMETMTTSAGGSVADASEDLGDGLILRRARPHDAAAVAALLVSAHVAATPAAGRRPTWTGSASGRAT